MQRHLAPRLMEACWATCSTVPVSCAESGARASILRARARWSWAAAASGRLSPRLSPQRESLPSACSMPTPIRGSAGGPACAAITRACRHHRLERPGQLRPRGQCDALGMNEGDPMPIDVSRIEASTFVGEVVMKEEMTAFLRAAQARGCRVQVGSRHAVRADTRLPGVFRLPEHHAGSPAFGRQAELLIAQQQACQLRLPEGGRRSVSDNYHPEM